MDGKLNVCLLNDSFPPLIDGVANAVLNYAKIISNRHGDAFVVVPEQPNAEDSYPFEVIRYKSFGAKISEPYRMGFPFDSSPAKALSDKNIDIIHSHCPIASGMLARSLKKSLGAPLIMTYHTKFDMDFRKAIKSDFLYNTSIDAMISNINACDDVWVVSKSAGDNLRSLGYNGDYIIMPNGVDFKIGRASDGAVQAVKNRHGLTDDGLNLLFVGRIRWYKGFKLMFDMLAKCKEVGMKVKLTVVGDGPDFDEVKSYAEKLGIVGEYCVFAGAVHDREELRAYYCSCNLFMLPSTYDTNGLVVGEAAACSLPSVVIENSGAAESVTDGQNGFTCRESWESLYSLICKLAGNKTKLLQVGSNALETIYVSWEASVNNAVNRYRYVLEKKQSGRLSGKKAKYDSVYSVVSAYQKGAIKHNEKKTDKEG